MINKEVSIMKRITRFKKKILKIKSYLDQLSFIVKIIVCICLISVVVIYNDTSYIDKGIRCNKMKGEYCTKYEIEKMVNNGQ